MNLYAPALGRSIYFALPVYDICKFFPFLTKNPILCFFRASDWDFSNFYPIPPRIAPKTNTTRVTPQNRYFAMG